MTVVYENGTMNSRITDVESSEEYPLVDVHGVSGIFLGKIREKYENKLEDIIKRCTAPEVFKSKQAKQIIEYVKNKYGSEPEYLWAKFPKNAVFRRSEDKKWYGALLAMSENKLGFGSDKLTEIIDLKGRMR